MREEAQARLTREATTVAGSIGPGGAGVTAGRLEDLVPADHAVRVEAPGGTVTAGPDPGPGATVGTTTLGRVTVTVAEPAEVLERRVRSLWLLVAVASGVALVVAAGLAAWQARRLARPLERLADASERLGRGELGTRAGPQDIAELGAVAEALDRSAERISDLVERERAFSSNVAHQLRTPLTALDMRLDELAVHPDPDVRREAEAGLEQTERMRRTTDDLLRLARHGHADAPAELDLAALVDARVDHWRGSVEAAGRRLERTGLPGPAPVTASRAALEAAIDVLAENALRHGAGTITVGVALADGFARISVADEGEGIDDDAATAVFRRSGDAGGIGLGLARAMLDSAGARLVLAGRHPTTFEIILPAG